MNSRPNRQLWLPLQVKGELGVCDLSAENPTEEWGLMERIVAPENLRAAYGRVMSNKGAPGIDGMTVESLARICGRSGPPSAGVCSREHTGPLSPLLANLLLDELDRELEARGHRFVRYADDCNIYVGSRRAGVRVMGSISGFLTDRLKLKVNEAKSAVGKPYERAFLGFSIVRGGKTAVSAKARDRLKAKIRELTGRNRGCSLRRMIGELATYLRGWKAYFRIATARRNLRELGAWMMRKLRCYLWKQWGGRG